MLLWNHAIVKIKNVSVSLLIAEIKLDEVCASKSGIFCLHPVESVERYQQWVERECKFRFLMLLWDVLKKLMMMAPKQKRLLLTAKKSLVVACG